MSIKNNQINSNFHQIAVTDTEGRITGIETGGIVLSDAANLTIGGGAAGQSLITDGAGNLSWSTVDSANAAYANTAGVADVALSVDAANIVGEVANATFATSASSATTAGSATVAASANAVAGANVSGTVANATFASSAGSATVAASANAVALANVTGVGNIASVNLNGNGSQYLAGNGTWAATASFTPLKYTREWHISPDLGNDTTGNGSYEKPYKTIMKAHAMIVSGEAVFLHGGVYTENVTWTKTNTDIIGLTSGGLIDTSGTWTVGTQSGASVRLTDLSFNGTFTQNGTGRLFFRRCAVKNSFTKTSGEYLQAVDTEFGTSVSINSAGTVVIKGGQTNGLTVNNASAVVNVSNLISGAVFTNTAGTLLVNDSIVYSATPTTAAITAAAGSVTYMYNSSTATSSGTQARVTFAGFWTVDSTRFDRANSTITGTNLGTVSYSDALTVFGITSLGAVGNVKITGGTSGQVLTTNGSGNLSFATVNNVANATFATTSGTTQSVTLANVSGAGNIAGLNLSTDANLVLSGNGTWVAKDSGPQGPQGIQGIQGETGATGAQGPIGPQGDKGDKGDKGDTGATGAQGIQGEQGIQGIQGEVGPQGIQGIQGETGSQGPQGVAGADGAQGIQGIQGETGPQGIQGEVGPQGIQGEQGIQGIQGETGATSGRPYYFNYSTPSGIAGYLTLGDEPTGNAQHITTVSATGSTSTLVDSYISDAFDFLSIPGGSQAFHFHMTKAAQNNQVDAYATLKLAANDGTIIATIGNTNYAPIGWDSNAANPVAVYCDIVLPTTTVQIGQRMVVEVYVLNRSSATHDVSFYTEGVSNYSLVTTTVAAKPGEQGPVGPQGPQGIQGETGPTGPQGIQGETGPQGIQGETGATGPQGIQGETGSTGAQGIQGETGPQGIQGIQGETGPTGPQGIQGETGAKGDKGDTGNTGAQGIQGEQGIQGPQGIQGEQGIQGPTGNTGPQGDQGVKGDKGDTGDTGATGAKGDTGDTGPAGPGIAVGGAAGQVLTKVDGTDYNTGWTSLGDANVNYANFAGVANSVAGANVSGEVAFAATANAVAGANVSGTVSLATTASTANGVARGNVGGVTGNAGQIQFNNTSGNLTSSERHWIAGNGTTTLNVSRDGGLGGIISGYSYMNGVSTASIFFARARGTKAAPLPVQVGDRVFSTNGHVYTGTGNVTTDGIAGWSPLSGLPGIAAEVTALPISNTTTYGSKLILTASNAATNSTVSASLNDDGILQAPRLRLTQPTIPSSATSPGQYGEITYDNDYVYVCIGTDLWKRSPLATW